MKTGIDAMMKSLDPYTVYYPESKIEDVRFMNTGQYGGIGVKVNTIDDKITITDIFDGSKSQNSGIKIGDVVVALDGKTVVGKNHTEINDLIKGANGSILKISVKRLNTPEELEFEIERGEVQVPDVPYYGMLDDKTGYIALRSFTKTASSEVKRTFLELKGQGMEQLVFDLRDNGGGLLREAVNIVNFFVPKGQEIVSTRGKIEDWNKSYGALNEPLDLNIPIVVLVNGSSASASEIVSGTLQDLDRAVVVGQRSFGKGLVQQTKDLDYNAKMKLTVAKYYTPSGRCIQKLNYAKKNADGSIAEVPDSLIKPFSTSKGRPVFDGRGIDPDVFVEEDKASNIQKALNREFILFDYATIYCQNKDSIDNPKEFSISGADYQSFQEFALQQEFELSTTTESLIKQLKESAESEKYFDGAEAEYQALQSKFTPNKTRDLQSFKTEITKSLEEEIVNRFYGNSGLIEHRLSDDQVIDEALKVLANDYKQILKQE
ncbi:MAG: S41 family peptidase, partial [Flavobacteriales bacterium]